MVRCKAHFDILNCLGVTHTCDRQTDGQLDGQSSKMPHFTTNCAAKKHWAISRNSPRWLILTIYTNANPNPYPGANPG